jgi:hypothetical protein
MTTAFDMKETIKTKKPWKPREICHGSYFYLLFPGDGQTPPQVFVCHHQLFIRKNPSFISVFPSDTTAS